MPFQHPFHVKLADALAAVPTPDGKLDAEVFIHGTLTMEIYTPKKIDLQQPHTRDEGYIVIAGSGFYVNENERVAFGPGDFLFAKAGARHRFEEFSDDFAAWVIFYGPIGGELI